MGLMDKITGRSKQAAGDIAGDASLRREGRQEERKGKEKDELARAQEKADEKAQDVADLERSLRRAQVPERVRLWARFGAGPGTGALSDGFQRRSGHTGDTRRRRHARRHQLPPYDRLV